VSVHRLAPLLDPGSLAFIGGAAAGRAVEQCLRMGFDGPIWAVHPTRQHLAGIPTVPTVADLPGVPDAAFVGVNRAAAVEAVRSLAEMGTGVTVCHASGFAEYDADGASMQDDLLAAAAGMPVVGPNCYGTISMTTGAVLWPDQQGLTRCETGVGFVTQSGNIAVNLTMQQRGLAVAQLISLGNQADVTIEDGLAALVTDERITAIGLHIEALTDGARFSDATRIAAERGVPIVALKTGTSRRGAAIAVTHTSSLAGTDAAYDALFDRCGVHRVRSVPELLDTLHVLTTIGRLGGNRIVSLSSSGGEAQLVADAAEPLALEFPPFTEDHRRRIKATLNEFVAATNPFDYHTFIWGDEPRLTACFTETLDGPFDAAMLVLDFPKDGLDESSWWPSLDAFATAVDHTGVPGVVTASMAEGLPLPVRARAHAAGLATVGDINTALSSLEAATRPSRPVDPPAVAAPPTTATTVLDEAAGKAVLVTAGVDTPAGATCAATPDAAVTTAAAVGYPVVTKALGITHKTEVGGVHLDLANADAVTDAIEHLAPLADDVLIEEFVGGRRIEVLVGVRAESPIGWLLTLGAGGTMTELLDDTTSLLLPTTATAIGRALRSLRIGPRFDGHRGAAPVDPTPLVELVEALTALVTDDPAIREIELNPVLVTATRAVAADAIIRREEPRP